MPTIAELNQRHPTCNVERTQDLEALYRGDECFDARLTQFLPKWELEPEDRYALRKKIAHYRNYLAVVIDYFAALLFAGKVSASAKTEAGQDVATPDPYYADFRGNCDGDGKDIEGFFKERLTEAMTHRCSWFALKHQPDDGVPPENLAEFQERKIGNCTLAAIPVGDVYDWECGDGGQLEWALAHSLTAKRAGLSGGRNQVTERWTHYLPDRVDVYGISYDKQNPPSASVDVALLPAESYSHRFGCVPVMCLEVPIGLWAANKLRTPQLAHFRASNAQTWSLASSCFAMLVFSVADPLVFAATAIGAGKGLLIGKDDKADWLAPPSEHYAALDVEIKSQKDEIFRLAHQMALGVENNAAAIGRSAESKASDSEATRVILEAYGELVTETMERVYDLISAVRGDKYTWSVDGLGDFASADVGALVDMLEKVEKFGGIPSVTWNSKNLAQLARAMRPDLAEDDHAKIAKEILEALNKKEAQADAIAQGDAALLDQAKAHLNGDATGEGIGRKPKASPGVRGALAAPPEA